MSLFYSAGLGGSTIPDNPDSPTNQWIIDQASGSTVADSIGSIDGTLVNGTRVADSEALGGYKISFDPDDGDVDYIDFAVPPTLVGFSSNTFSIAITVEDVPSLDTTAPIWTWDDNSGSFFGLGTDDSGQVGFGNGSENTGAGTAQGNIATGKARLVGIVDNGSVAFYANATEYTGLHTPNKFTSSGNGGTMRIGALQDRTDSALAINSAVDNPIVYSDPLIASQVQTDYDNQPWS